MRKRLENVNETNQHRPSIVGGKGNRLDTNIAKLFYALVYYTTVTFVCLFYNLKRLLCNVL